MSGDEKGYNGCTNWETWNVGLWLDNDQDTYNTARNLVNIDAVDAFEDWVTRLIENELKQDAGIARDFIQAAIHEINFEELYNHYKEDE